MTPAETPDLHGAFPRLSDEQIAALAAHGDRRATRAGDVLYREGEPAVRLLRGPRGQVAMVEGYATSENIAVHGPGRFLGELSLLTGSRRSSPRWCGAGRGAGRPGRAAARGWSPRTHALGDLILRAYLSGARCSIELGAGLRIVGSRFSTRHPPAARVRGAQPPPPPLDRPRGRRPAPRPCCADSASRPRRRRSSSGAGTRCCATRQRRARPRDRAAPRRRSAPMSATSWWSAPGRPGWPPPSTAHPRGSPPSSSTAVATGGQAGTSPRIENYLGFPSGISGAELAERAVIQAEKFGAQISVPAEATALERHDGHHVVRLDDGSGRARAAVLIATGARYRGSTCPGLDEFEGDSVYYAATWVEARLCAGDPVVIVGGGNSAGQAAVFLARPCAGSASSIRHEDLGRDMSRYLVDQIERNPTVEVLRCTEVRELVGDGRPRGRRRGGPPHRRAPAGWTPVRCSSSSAPSPTRGGWRPGSPSTIAGSS